MDADNSRELVVADPDRVSYRVRAVKKGMWLRGDLELGGGASLVDVAINAVLDVLIGLFVSARADSQTAWKVGVFRQGRASQRLVHKELLSPGQPPEQRMQELSRDIEAGNTAALNR